MSTDAELEQFAHNEPFEATFNGARYRFEKTEHFNIGPGWMLTELDGKLPRGVYSSSKISDPKPLPPEPPRTGPYVFGERMRPGDTN